MTTDPLTLANQAVPQVIKWTESAKSGLEHSYPLPPGGVDELVQVTRDAMEVHFHISTAVQGQQATVDVVLATYDAMLSSISTGIAFEGVSEEEARQDNMTPAWQNPPPAYTKPGEYIRFSPIFREYDAVSGEGEGPLCRATIVMHELAHYVNENVVDYVREYDPRYDSLPAEFAVKNASCYPAFAQQVDTGTDQRYGSGRVSE